MNKYAEHLVHAEIAVRAPTHVALRGIWPFVSDLPAKLLEEYAFTAAIRRTTLTDSGRTILALYVVSIPCKDGPDGLERLHRILGAVNLRMTGFGGPAFGGTDASATLVSFRHVTNGKRPFLMHDGPIKVYAENFKTNFETISGRFLDATDEPEVAL